MVAATDEGVVGSVVEPHLLDLWQTGEERVDGVDDHEDVDGRLRCQSGHRGAADVLDRRGDGTQSVGKEAAASSNSAGHADE